MQDTSNLLLFLYHGLHDTDFDKLLVKALKNLLKHGATITAFNLVESINQILISKNLSILWRLAAPPGFVNKKQQKFR